MLGTGCTQAWSTKDFTRTKEGMTIIKRIVTIEILLKEDVQLIEQI